jgi:hypothetical protein
MRACDDFIRGSGSASALNQPTAVDSSSATCGSPVPTALHRKVRSRYCPRLPFSYRTALGPEETARGLDIKRGFDLVVSGLLLLLTWPLLLALAVAVRMDSAGPAMFRQQRVGLDGEIFAIHKFRSMRLEPAGALFSATGDVRVTRVGQFLRKSKLDELP